MYVYKDTHYIYLEKGLRVKCYLMQQNKLIIFLLP